MYKLVRVRGTDIVRDPDQPRKLFDEADLLGIGQNMLTYGQHVPLILYQAEAKLMLLDGERRWRGGTLVGITEYIAMLLAERPSLAQLRILQASIDIHKVSLSPMERSNMLAAMQAESGSGPTELAGKLNMRQPMVSKLLNFQKLGPAVQHLLHTGALDMEKGNLISQEPDFEKQMELATTATHVSRDQLRAKIRGHGNGQKRQAKRAVFMLPGGVSVTVQGGAVTLESAIQSLSDTLRELKRGLSQGLDIRTAQNVLRDTAKAR